MVRCYKQKGTRKSKYSKEQLHEALEQVKSRVASVKGASRTFGIPVSTLRDHLSGRRGAKSNTFGRPTALPHDVENNLAKALTVLEKWGHGLSRYDILDLVEKYVTINNLKTPFKNNKPGEDWFLNFKTRHKLSIKKPQSLEYSRKQMTNPFVIQEYFELLYSTLRELDVLTYPNKIWNLDETSLSLDPHKTKVVGARGKSCSRVTSGPGRENVTVLFAVSAAGQKAPPLVFKAKNLWNEWIPTEPAFPGMPYASSPNGWMQSDIFLNYFKTTLIPAIGSERPALVIYDGHSTHVTIDVVNLAIEEQITILKLPPHTSHLLQPLDLSVFKPMKDTWDRKLASWQRTNIGKKIPKLQFSTMVSETWRDLKIDVIKNGFKKAGIFPFNNEVISEDKYDPNALHRWKLHQRANLDPSISGVNIDDILPTQNSTAASISTLITSPQHDPAILVTPDDATAGTSASSTSGISFENLIAETLRQSIQPPKKTKRRIATGSEVLTTSQAKQRTDSLLKKKKTVHSSSEESEADEHPIYMDTDDSLNLESDDDENYFDEAKVGKWIIAKYASKKAIRYYVGKITDKSKNGTGWIVRFTKYNRGKFIWPEEDDIDEIEASDVVRVLPDPKNHRRGNAVVFDVDFDSFNLKIG